MSKLPITEADLHACADGLLPEARRAEVEAYVASKPGEPERLRAYREQNDAIRTMRSRFATSTPRCGCFPMSSARSCSSSRSSS